MSASGIVRGRRTPADQAKRSNELKTSDSRDNSVIIKKINQSNSIVNHQQNLTNIDVYSYGNFCERIVVRNTNQIQIYSRHRHDASSSSSSGGRNTDEAILMDQGGFLSPPEDPTGYLYDLSDRPVLCSSQSDNEFIFGSSDHALYSIKLSESNHTKKFTQMYSKTMGHTDWVTATCHLADSRVLSGGMDCRVLLWSLDRHSCVDLQGHDMSVTKILSLKPLNTAVSFSYDKRGAIWNFGNKAADNISVSGSRNSSSSTSTSRNIYSSNRTSSSAVVKQRPVDFLLGHSEAIVECTVMKSTLTESSISETNTDLYVISGDRCGEIKVWDMNKCEALTTISRRNNQNGYVTCLCDFDSHHTFMSGGVDGHIRLYDIRQGNLIASVSAHVEMSPSTSIDTNSPTVPVAANSTESTTRDITAKSGSITQIPSSTTSSTSRRSLKPSRLVARASNAYTNVSSPLDLNIQSLSISNTSSPRSTGALPSNNNVVAKSNSNTVTQQSGAIRSVAAVSCLSRLSGANSNSSSPYSVSGGSDGALVLMDIRQISSGGNTGSSSSRAIVSKWAHHKNGVHSLLVVNNECVFTGDGQGTLYCHNILQGNNNNNSNNNPIILKYGLGASQVGAVKTINVIHPNTTATKGYIVTGGDDGKAIAFKYRF